MKGQPPRDSPISYDKTQENSKVILRGVYLVLYLLDVWQTTADRSDTPCNSPTFRTKFMEPVKRDSLTLRQISFLPRQKTHSSTINQKPLSFFSKITTVPGQTRIISSANNSLFNLLCLYRIRLAIRYARRATVNIQWCMNSAFGTHLRDHQLLYRLWENW